MVDKKFNWIDQGLGIINKAKPFIEKNASGIDTTLLYTHMSLIVWKFRATRQLLISYHYVYFKINWLG